MNPQRTNKSKAKGKGRKGPKPQVLAVPRKLVDPRMRDYQRLLLDPCNAPLTESPYGDSAGSTIARGHQVFVTVGDSSILFYHPVFGMFTNSAAAGTVGALKPYYTGQTNLPTSSRAIACCAETAWVAAESARAGTVQCGVVPGSVVAYRLGSAYGGQNVGMDVNDALTYIPNFERMPVDKCAINWFPGKGDNDFSNTFIYDTTATPYVQKMAQTNFLVVFVTGTGTAGNVRISITEVLEQANKLSIIGTSGNSIPVWTVQPRSHKPIDYEEAVADLSSKDPQWYLNTFRKLATFGLGLGKAAYTAGLPGALGYLTQAIAGGPSWGGNGKYIRNAT